MFEIKLKRAYEAASADDGVRVLVDKLWPRGVKKETLALDYWAKEVTPSTEIRKEFNHEASKFDAFKKAYMIELENNSALDDFVKKVGNWLQKSDVTFIYGAKDPKINHAVILREVVKKRLEK